MPNPPLHPALLADPLALGLGDEDRVALPDPTHPTHLRWLAMRREAGLSVPAVEPLEAERHAELGGRLRAVVGALGTPRVIGIGGPAGSGRTSVLTALAELAARAGLRTAALDCDLNHPALLRQCGIDALPLTLGGLVLTLPLRDLRLQSLGGFWPEPQPLPWHGRELERVLSRYREDVLWGNPDIIFLDLPALPDPRHQEVLDFFGAEYWEVEGPTRTALPRRTPSLTIANAVSEGREGLPYRPAGDLLDIFCTRLPASLPPSWTKGFSSSS